ncbi:MAG: OmpH family outer membrane protein [Proteobacteria bacterium TMED72]|nr:MAG: OmpH family outer membrane protein [Proteobacteria bacterium TMED72]
MTRNIWRAAVIMMLVLGLGMTAQAEDTKIGFVDLDQAIGATAEGKAAREELERKMREAELDMKPLMERYQSLGEEYQKKSVVLSPEKLREMQLDITELENQLKLKQSEFENRLQLDRQRLVEPLMQRLQLTVNEVGRDQGFSLILIRGAPGVLYYKEALDITDVVIEQFNKEK